MYSHRLACKPTNSPGEQGPKLATFNPGEPAINDAETPIDCVSTPSSRPASTHNVTTRNLESRKFLAVNEPRYVDDLISWVHFFPFRIPDWLAVSRAVRHRRPKVPAKLADQSRSTALRNRNGGARSTRRSTPKQFNAKSQIRYAHSHGLKYRDIITRLAPALLRNQ